MADNVLITTPQARARGLTYAEIRRLVRAGVWLRVLRGIYVIAATVTMPMPALHRRAALRLAGDDGWLCGLSALAEYGVVVGSERVTHLAMRRTGAMRGDRGLCVHRAAHDGSVEWRGLRMERFDAAVVSAFATLKDESQRQELLCRVVRERRTTVARLRAAAGARGRFRGSPRFRFILGLVELGCHSPIEIDYLLLIERPFGLPSADRQRPLRRDRNARRPGAYGDVYYPELRLLVELDGSENHVDAQRRRDLRRDLGMATTGIQTLRITGEQIRRETAKTAAAILAVMEERRALLGLAS